MRIRALFLGLVVLACCGTVTHISNDSKNYNGSNVTSFPVTAVHTPNPGDYLIVNFSFNSNSATMSASGWTCPAKMVNVDKLYWCYEQVPSGTASTWTFSTGGVGTVNGYCWYMQEYAGVSAVSVSWAKNNGNNISSETLTWSAPTTTSLPVMWIGSSGAGTTGISSGWTGGVSQSLANTGAYCYGENMFFGPETAASGAVTATFSPVSTGIYDQMNLAMLSDANPAPLSNQGNFMGSWLRDRFEDLLNTYY